MVSPATQLDDSSTSVGGSINVPLPPITRARAKRLRESLNTLVQAIHHSHEGLIDFKEECHGPILYLEVQEEN